MPMIKSEKRPTDKLKKDDDKDFNSDADPAKDKAATDQPVGRGRPRLERKNPELYMLEPSQDALFYCPVCASSI